ncbi:rhamnan synthesis F family protein [Consotaella salsifontis]|nr:rhamnan synthesis F family protein [Consotaella salsifontis]
MPNDGPQQRAKTMMAEGGNGVRPAFVLFVHVFYPDIWTEMAAHVAATVRVPFRVVITTPHDPQKIDVVPSDFLVSQAVRQVENRGRDVLPFLLALEAEGEGFEIGLKLHTKHSPHRADGGAWRRSIIRSLLPSAPETAAIVDAFDHQPHLGLVAPRGLLLPLRDRLNDNRGSIRRVGRATGKAFTRREIRQGYFPAGSMFWFRRDALKDLSAQRLFSEFEAEAAQLDATAAHALERMFALAAERRGYVALPVDLIDAAGTLRTAGEAHEAVANQPISEHAWQPPRLVLFVLRWVPFAHQALLRLPRPVRHFIRNLIMGKPPQT